jgi:hypothetical protein
VRAAIILNMSFVSSRQFKKHKENKVSLAPWHGIHSAGFNGLLYVAKQQQQQKEAKKCQPAVLRLSANATFSRMRANSAGVSELNTLMATTTGTPNLRALRTWRCKLQQPASKSTRFSCLYSYSTDPRI